MTDAITQEDARDALLYREEFIHPDLIPIWQTYQRVYGVEVLLHENEEVLSEVIHVEPFREELHTKRVAIETTVAQKYSDELQFTFDKVESR